MHRRRERRDRTPQGAPYYYRPPSPRRGLQPSFLAPAGRAAPPVSAADGLCGCGTAIGPSAGVRPAIRSGAKRAHHHFFSRFREDAIRIGARQNRVQNAFVRRQYSQDRHANRYAHSTRTAPQFLRPPKRHRRSDRYGNGKAGARLAACVGPARLPSQLRAPRFIRHRRPAFRSAICDGRLRMSPMACFTNYDSLSLPWIHPSRSQTRSP